MPVTRDMERLNRLSRRQPWLKLFLTFLDRLRIDSKELVAEDERGSKIEMWSSQRSALEQIAEGMNDDRFMFYILKSRQAGISTLTLAILLFWVAVRPRTIAALVCNKEEVRDAFRDTLTRYHASFPENFFGDRFGKVRHNSSHYLFSNGSRIDYLIAGKRSTSWGESRGYSVCLCTEVADYGTFEGIRSFIEALAQENPHRLFLFESTAKGMNHWHEMWADAEDELTIGRIFLGWWSKEGNSLRKNDPRYRRFGINPPDGEETRFCNEVYERYNHVVTMEQLAWYRWKLSTTDRPSMEQNNPWTDTQAFVLSGWSYFAIRTIQNRYDEIYTTRPPMKAYRFVMGNNFWAMKLEEIRDQSRFNDIELKVWEEPVKGGQYVIGCDPAGSGSGDGKNNHAISVWRVFADKMVQVAEFADNFFQTNHCAWILAGLAGAYKDCIVNLELYGPGRVVMAELDNIRTQLRQELFNPMNEANAWDEDFMAGARWFMYRRVDNPGPGFVFNFECLALDTRLPTPDGWTTMGGVREGDYLISDTGKPTRVIGLSDIKLKARCFRITFDDDTAIVADENHWWKVARLHWKNKADKLRKTKQLEPGKFYIRQAEPLDLPEKELPIDPYLLGVWLGDGASAGSRVYCGDQDIDEMVSNIEACGQPTTRVRHRTCWNIGLTDPNNWGAFTRSLRDLGVLNNKHIPKSYLRASISQRFSLLQGLMDTDGGAGGNGGPACNFVTSSKPIAAGFSELVRSLGFKAKFLTHDESLAKGVECALRYQFWFTAYPENPVFRLKRKAACLSRGERKSYRKPCHRIVSIKEVQSVPVRCVMVDSPTNMFLAGAGMIPTHNTTQRRKVELFTLFRDMWQTDTLIVNSVKLLEEMASMVQEEQDIAPAAPGRALDDRPFAAALAVWAWDKSLRNALIGAGATYDRVMSEEAGESSVGARMMDRLVYSYFARREEEAELAEDGGAWASEGWRASRGLLG